MKLENKTSLEQNDFETITESLKDLKKNNNLPQLKSIKWKVENFQNSIDLKISQDAKEKLNSMWVSFDKNSDWTIKINWTWTKKVVFSNKTKEIDVSMCYEKNNNFWDILINSEDIDWTKESYSIKEGNTKLSMQETNTWKTIIERDNDQYLLGERFNYINRISKNWNSKKNWWSIINIENNPDMLWSGKKIIIKKWNLEYKINRSLDNDGTISVYNNVNWKELESKEALNIINEIYQ